METGCDNFIVLTHSGVIIDAEVGSHIALDATPEDTGTDVDNSALLSYHMGGVQSNCHRYRKESMQLS